jgi:hypothetical protein
LKRTVTYTCSACGLTAVTWNLGGDSESVAFDPPSPVRCFHCKGREFDREES